MKEKVIALVLAGGQGKRMQSDVQKQYMQLNDYPVLYYSLKQFEESAVDEIILVVAKGEITYCQKEIVERFCFKKVKQVVEGGKERYESVYHGLQVIDEEGYVLIHDGARPLITSSIIQTSIDGVKKYKACVVGMPVKDTIKVVNEQEVAVETPNRSSLWLVQTPQSFEIGIVKKAYEKMMEAKDTMVTDDAMVVEKYEKYPIKLLKGSYENIKITTPEDLIIAKGLLDRKEDKSK